MLKDIMTITSLKSNIIKRQPVGICLSIAMSAIPFLFVFFFGVKGTALAEACIGGNDLWYMFFNFQWDYSSIGF
jgi:hypothetical protein